MIGRKLPPAEDQQETDRGQTDRTQECGILDGVDVHAEQERKRRVAAEGADPCPRNHAEERKDVAADRVERYAGGGFLLRQIEVEDVRVREVDPDAAEVLDERGERPQPFHTGRQREHEEFRRGEEQARQTERLDPRIPVQDFLPQRPVHRRMTVYIIETMLMTVYEK